MRGQADAHKTLFAASENANSMACEARGQMRIIVIDDDVELLEELQEVLEANGHTAEVISDPSVAVRVILESKPDAVLLDLKMKGKSGFEIAAELSEDPRASAIPVIAMTGHYGEDELDKLRESGVVRSFLTKPLSILELVAELGEVSD
jgi:DNA-binding response OmpR family regulator